MDTASPTQPGISRSPSGQQPSPPVSEEQTQSLAKVRMGRNVKACQICRRTKIKCKMSRGAPPCDRCRARGLDCRAEKTQQAMIEEGSRWRQDMAGQVVQIRTAVNILLRMSNLPQVSAYGAENVEESDHGVVNDDNKSLPSDPIVTPVAPEDDKLYSLPISSLYEVTRMPSLRSSGHAGPRNTTPSDLISRGIITESVAEQLFQHFQDRVSWFCYGILCPHKDLSSLRHSSPMLTAAICAVSALHDPNGSNYFPGCNGEYLRLVSQGMFSHSHTTDDIRALIVGSYWLGNVSFVLLSHAIRIATLLNLHLAYFAVVNKNEPHSERHVEEARLWYTLHVMDHHSSILYGRPSIISSNEEPHQQWETFIEANGNEEVDLRISSQVALYHIMAKVKEVFGGYKLKSVPEHCLPQLHSFFVELDRWYMIWGNRMPENARIGWFPRDGAILHYHFARLHLCSYIFRSMTTQEAAAASQATRDYAQLAVTSATSVLELVLERQDLNKGLVGMPVYFHGMITFAAVFLIKAAGTDFLGLTPIDSSKVVQLVQDCVRTLRFQKAARQHLVYHLSNGLEDLLQAAKLDNDEAAQTDEEPMIMSQPAFMPLAESAFAIDPFELLQPPMEGTLISGGSDGYDWSSQFNMQTY